MQQLGENFFKKAQFGMTPVMPQGAGSPQGASPAAVGQGLPQQNQFASSNELSTSAGPEHARNAVAGIDVSKPGIPPEGQGRRLNLFA